MKEKQIEIKICTPDRIRPFRAKILRPGQALEASVYPGEEAPACLHMAAVQGEHIIGCITWLPDEAQWTQAAVGFLEPKIAFRLRGMAVDPSARKLGIGRKLVEESLQILQSRGSDFVWCNAREAAYSFYEKLQFQFYGEVFDIPTIGPHKIMWRKLTKTK